MEAMRCVPREIAGKMVSRNGKFEGVVGKGSMGGWEGINGYEQT